MPAFSQPRVPGYRFKDGRLMIFSEEEVMLIRGWEEPSAVCKGDDVWEPFVPEFRLVAPYRRVAKKSAKKAADPVPPPTGDQLSFDLFADAPPIAPAAKPVIPKPTPLAEQRRKAFDSFRFSLPKEVAKVLEPFRSHQWPLLVLLAHDKRVLDLASANPVLAYAVADWYADYPRSQLDFGKMPQRDLLKLLRLPDSAAMVKLLRKIPPESVDRHHWPSVLAGLRHPEGAAAKWLSHVPSLNLGVMALIFQPGIRAAITPALLAETAADPKEKYRARTASLLDDIINMREQLADARPLPGMKSVEKILQLHAEVAEDFHKLERMRNDLGLLPPPPVPGVDGRIQPLESQAELVAEGRAQKNCVATYAAAVASRSCYIYRVLHPERATLCIRRQADGNWRISELEASCNRPVCEDTRHFVNQWLEPHKLGL